MPPGLRSSPTASRATPDHHRSAKLTTTVPTVVSEALPAGKYASAIFGGMSPRKRSLMWDDTKRCSRSRRARVSTTGRAGVRCGLFLNNRHHDPTTGTFLSVDPLVASTGTAYLYAGGNPTTYSDPSGLDPKSSNQCGPVAGTTCPSGGGRPTPGASNMSVPASASTASFGIPKWRGSGVTRIQYFIATDRVCLSGTGPDIACGHGDNRGFVVGQQIRTRELTIRALMGGVG